MIKYNYTEENRIEFKEIHNEDSFTHGFIKPDDEQELIDSGVDIAEYIEPEKTKDQLRGEVLAELKALDSSTRLIEGVLLGDQYSIDKLAENESFKIDLREKLAAI
jgi:hypothetical protein